MIEALVRDRWRVEVGDARDVLYSLPPGLATTVIFSPAYWGLRRYQTSHQVWGGAGCCEHEWIWASTLRRSNDSGKEGRKQGTNKGSMGRDVPDTWGMCSECYAWFGELGSEPTPELYVQHMVELCRAAKHILAPWGTMWLNIGDSYYSKPTGANWGVKHPYLKPNDLCLIPAQLAIALQRDGWWLRQEIVWHKPNAMPDSSTARVTRDFEMVYTFTRHGTNYYFDAEAIREPATTKPQRRLTQRHSDRDAAMRSNRRYDYTLLGEPGRQGGDTRNKRSVWSINTAGVSSKKGKAEHYAAYPEALVLPMILAGTSERGRCPTCQLPWERVVKVTRPDRQALTDEEWKLYAYRKGLPFSDRKARARAGLDLHPLRDDRGRTASLPEQRMGKSPPPERGWENSRETIGWRPALTYGHVCKCYDEKYNSDFSMPRKARKRAQRAAWANRKASKKAGTPAGRWFRLRARPGKDDWPTIPDLVVDPCLGTGTTLKVALANNRIGLGVELSEKYAKHASSRLEQAAFACGSPYVFRPDPDARLLQHLFSPSALQRILDRYPSDRIQVREEEAQPHCMSFEGVTIEAEDVGSVGTAGDAEPTTWVNNWGPPKSPVVLDGMMHRQAMGHCVAMASDGTVLNPWGPPMPTPRTSQVVPSERQGWFDVKRRVLNLFKLMERQKIGQREADLLEEIEGALKKHYREVLGVKWEDYFP